MSKPSPKPPKPATPRDGVWFLHRADGTRLGNTSYDTEAEARREAVSWFVDKTLVPVRYVPAKED